VGYAEEAIDELFTEDEANQLAAYLDAFGEEHVTTIKEAALPIPKNMMGVGAIPVGGGDDFYMLCKQQEYFLPFEVWGYFDLVGCELIDGRDVYHHRLWVVHPNGDMHRQSNEEAARDGRPVQ